MKYMITVEFTMATGNRYREDPSMRRELEALFERTRPESLYVGLIRRVVYMVVDTEDPAVLGDIHTTLTHLADAAPECHPVVPGAHFVKLSNQLAEAHDPPPASAGGSESPATG